MSGRENLVRDMQKQSIPLEQTKNTYNSPRAHKKKLNHTKVTFFFFYMYDIFLSAYICVYYLNLVNFVLPQQNKYDLSLGKNGT